MALLTPRKCVQSTLCVSFFLFIIINVQFFAPAPAQVAHVELSRLESNIEPRKLRASDGGNSTQGRDSPLSFDKRAKPDVPILTEKSPNMSKGKPADDSSAQRFQDFNESLGFIIDDINRQQTIRNREKFPPGDQGMYRHAFVVQVHNRDHYLKYLINSLRSTQGVNTSLLIVSHDFYCKDMFDIIASIDFMPVMQIFYPKAMQLYKNSYPGPDPADCPRDFKKEQAKKEGCVNADWPDKYGHYREAAYAQTKLHWFWKLHQVFDVLDIMRNFTGYVTLIEEDHFVTEDTLHVLDLMLKQKESLCPACRILTLGNYDKKPTYVYTAEVVAAPDFISSKHNMAMTLNRNTYNLIKQYAKPFCDYDDYNWDWSLQYVGREVIPGKLPTLVVKTPRVYHIGDCGVHHKGKKCNPEEKAQPILDRVRVNRDKLFPSTLKIGRSNTNTYLTYKKLKANGGWGDKRDHDLCASFMA